MSAAVDMVGLFLEEGSTVVGTQNASGDVAWQYTKDQPVAPSASVSVLINRGSASASEIVAAALADAGRATIVGETSFGKGTVQQLSYFSSGGALKVTIARWLRPSGQWIDGVGVTPDVEVERIDDDEAARRCRAGITQITQPPYTACYHFALRPHLLF